MSRQCTHYGRWPQHDFTSLKKLRPQSVTSRIQPGSDVIVCAEMDEQWGYVGAKSRQRWLFYAYDRIRRTVVWRTYSVNARCPRWSIFWACCRPLRSWYG
uniref:IS1 family transposase n=1 Tax=Enterobacter cloacae complex sp. 280C5 TaxID=3395861 RepID=UPI003CED2380